jgi:hypothetical protein
MLLTHRKLLQSKAIAIENDLRGTLRNFGLKVGMVGKVNQAPAYLVGKITCRQYEYGLHIDLRNASRRVGRSGSYSERTQRRSSGLQAQS